jgi:hypothetical protein
VSSTDLQVFDNPYDPTVQDFQQKTLPLDQIVELGLRKVELRLNVWRPAKIVNVKGNGRVDLEILLQSRYINNPKPFTLPTIQDALVCLVQGSDYYSEPPMAVGDTGIALFCDRSLDQWSVQGGTVYDPNPRLHHLSDCVFIPGVYPFSAQIQDSTTDWVFNTGNAQIRLLKNGNVLLGGKSAANPLVLGDVLVNGLTDMVTALNNLESAMMTLNTATMTFANAIGGPAIGIIGSPTPGSPVPPSAAIIAASAAYSSALSSYSSALSAFQTAMSMFKSKYLTTTSTNILSQILFTERNYG